MLVNVTPFGLTGRQAESAMRDATITLNRNSLPFDANGPWYTSGLRIGTPALTTLGMGPDEMVEIASIVKTVLANTSASKITKGRNAGTLSKARYHTDEAALQQAQKQVSELLARFPVYPEIDLEFLQESFN